MSSGEEFAINILKEKLGIEKMMRAHIEGMSYDYNAEKGGEKYSLEVKMTGVGGRYTVPEKELRDMADQFLEGRKPLLFFVTEKGLEKEYYIFKMIRCKIGYKFAYIEYPFNNEER